MRRLLSLASLLSLALLAPSAAWATDAPIVQSNPQGAQYLATYARPGLTLEVSAQTPLNGTGVSFVININGNSTIGNTNYIYHIHELPVPSDGNCSGTLAHLDPYARGEATPCDASNRASCQVGDLSGKHGVIPTLPGFSANYTDDYVSLTPGTPAFMGNRSFVLHFANKTRIACANFNLVQRNNASSVATGPGSTTTSTTGGSGAAGGSTVTASPGGSVVASAGGGGSMNPPAAASSGPAVANAALSLKEMSIQRNAKVIGPLVLVIAAAVW